MLYIKISKALVAWPRQRRHPTFPPPHWAAAPAARAATDAQLTRLPHECRAIVVRSRPAPDAGESTRRSHLDWKRCCRRRRPRVRTRVRADQSTAQRWNAEECATCATTARPSTASRRRRRLSRLHSHRSLQPRQTSRVQRQWPAQTRVVPLGCRASSRGVW